MLQQTISFTVTEKAISQIKKLQKELKKVGQPLRIDVLPGGCAGFKYFMDFEEKPEQGDVLHESSGVKLLFRSESLDVLEGTELDYIESLDASGFQFNNPNMTHSCKCGKSVC